MWGPTHMQPTASRAAGSEVELFDYIEVFYNQRRRHSTLGQISPAAFERGTPPAREGKDGTI
jgi:transposase InsO family protein